VLETVLKWLLILVVIPVCLLIWRMAADRDQERERDKLVKAIREELAEVRRDIIKEIRSK
jgi:hypothetical protein